MEVINNYIDSLYKNDNSQEVLELNLLMKDMKNKTLAKWLSKNLMVALRC